MGAPFFAFGSTALITKKNWRPRLAERRGGGAFFCVRTNGTHLKRTFFPRGNTLTRPPPTTSVHSSTHDHTTAIATRASAATTPPQGAPPHHRARPAPHPDRTQTLARDAIHDRVHVVALERRRPRLEDHRLVALCHRPAELANPPPACQRWTGRTKVGAACAWRMRPCQGPRGTRARALDPRSGACSRASSCPIGPPAIYHI